MSGPLRMVDRDYWASQAEADSAQLDRLSHDDELRSQSADALDLVDLPAEAFLRWPFPDLDALTGGIAPGDVWYPCAFSGNGKTTFVSSCLDLWFEEGKKIYVMPLEIRPKVFRTMWACQRIGLAPGDVLSGMLAREIAGEFGPRTAIHAVEQRKRLVAEVQLQTKGKFREQVRVSPVTEINAVGVARAYLEAAEWEADLIVIDHIDHIAGSGKGGLHEESVRVNKAVLNLSQEYGLATLATSQLNNAMLTGGRDRLAQYGPPQPHHVFMGGHKRQNATGMIGLHRKLRERGDDEDVKEYNAHIHAARIGDMPVHSVLEPGVMGVTAMKLRNYGERENLCVYMGVERGKLMHIPERDQYRTSYTATRRL